MGASEWYEFAPYRADVQLVFAEVQARVVASGGYYRGHGGQITIGSMDELRALRQTEWFSEEGTHSILDMEAVVAEPSEINPAATDFEAGLPEIFTIRALAADQVSELFGTDKPDRDAFMTHRKSDSYADFPRWHGRYAVLYQGNEPHEYVFWGFSGD